MIFYKYFTHVSDKFVLGNTTVSPYNANDRHFACHLNHRINLWRVCFGYTPNMIKSYPTEKGIAGILQPIFHSRTSDIWITFTFMITYFYTHVNPNRVKNTYIKEKATMNEYILTEFSIFYKRLIRVELYLKTLIIQKYITTYGDNAYNIIYRYIKTIEQRRNSNDKTFEKIHQSKINNEEKLQQVINKMYISELLNFFVNAVYLKNKRVRNNFFEEPIQTNSTNFQQKCKILKDFRNCIAHCNIKKYTLERAKI
jgi:hypothetical protein